MIRFRNTRTGRTVPAKDWKDVSLMVKIEQDRRSGIQASDIRESEPTIIRNLHMQVAD